MSQTIKEELGGRRRREGTGRGEGKQEKEEKMDRNGRTERVAIGEMWKKMSVK